MIVATIPAFVMVLGIVLWCLPINGTIREIGKWCFVLGLFYVLAALSHASVHF